VCLHFPSSQPHYLLQLRFIWLHDKEILGMPSSLAEGGRFWHLVGRSRSGLVREGVPRGGDLSWGPEETAACSDVKSLQSQLRLSSEACVGLSSPKEAPRGFLTNHDTSLPSVAMYGRIFVRIYPFLNSSQRLRPNDRLTAFRYVSIVTAVQLRHKALVETEHIVILLDEWQERNLLCLEA
jgi:hypothetical protein